MRNKTIDVMKSFSIIGIVLLHAMFIHYGENTASVNILRLVCVNGFLFTSGFVMYGKVDKNGWLIEKVIRRIPLLLVFTLIYYIFYMFAVGIDGGQKITTNIISFYSYQFISGFDGLVLWYVWQLILCTVALHIFEKYQEKLKLPYSLKFFLMCLIVATIPIGMFGFRFMSWYGLFIFAGYFVNHLINTKFRYSFHGIGVVISAIVLIGILIYDNDVILYSGQAINGGFVNIIGSFRYLEFHYMLLYILVSTWGIAGLYSISKFISKYKISKPLIYIGGATVGVYLLHKPFLELNFINNYWLATLFAFSVSLLLYQLLKRVKILDYLLFGGTDMPIKLTNRLEDWYAKAKA